MSAAEELPDAQKCHAFNVFNKVGCTREEGHSGAHLHVYDSGHVCGWAAAVAPRETKD